MHTAHLTLRATNRHHRPNGSCDFGGSGLHRTLTNDAASSSSDLSGDDQDGSRRYQAWGTTIPPIVVRESLIRRPSQDTLKKATSVKDRTHEFVWTSSVDHNATICFVARFGFSSRQMTQVPLSQLSDLRREEGSAFFASMVAIRVLVQVTLWTMEIPRSCNVLP